MKQREKILAQIRNSLNRDSLSLQEMRRCHERLIKNERGIFSRLTIDERERLINFERAASNAHANLIHLNELATIPEEILKIMHEHSLPLSLHLPENDLLKNLPWYETQIEINRGTVKHDDAISLTTCFCGIAETGTLVILSKQHCSTLNFFSSIHVVLLRSDQIVSYYEDAWDSIRAENYFSNVHFITGPSRTADIEQKLELGMHGPKHLYILIYNRMKDS